MKNEDRKIENKEEMNTLLLFEKLRQTTKRKININNAYNLHVRPYLSKRESQVMDMVLDVTMEGVCSSEEIASKMGVSRRSVRTYTDRVIQNAKLINLDDAKGRLYRCPRLINERFHG